MLENYYKKKGDNIENEESDTMVHDTCRKL